MSDYYIAIDGQQTGPFTIDELKQKLVYRDTLVWTEGMENWTEAQNVPLLQEVIKTPPPRLPQVETASPSPPAPTQTITPVTYTTTTPILVGEGKYFGYQLARRRERFLAALLQMVILFIPYQIVRTLTFFTIGYGSFSFIPFVFGLGLAAGVGALFYPMWSGNLGHKILGLKVISAIDGSDKKDSATGAIREVLKNVLSFFLLPVIWLLWDQDRQNIYDKVVRTYVVKARNNSIF